jgi:nucleoside-diphosphate-sugar epimerase
VSSGAASAEPAAAGHRVVAVTGASGFVGRALCERLRRGGFSLRRIVRADAGGDGIAVGDIGPHTQWRDALAGVDAVVHLAARVHHMRDPEADPLAQYRRVNVEATRGLANAAAQGGVRRLVFLSSVKVNGEFASRPFTEQDPPRPLDPYGVSKWEGEQALAGICARTGLECVVLRAPLVYGPGVRANFLSLMRAVARGIPLPLGAVDNRRSLVYVGNLVDAIGGCLVHPAAAGRTFLINDGEDLSTAELVRRLARALHVRARLLPVPVAALRLAARLTGRTAALDRLLGSLRIDGSAIRHTLQWQPPFDVDTGLAATACWYREAVAHERPKSG